MIGLFIHKKTNKIVEVDYFYNWSANQFHADYLGRHFCDSDDPYIGRNWDFICRKESVKNPIGDQKEAVKKYRQELVKAGYLKR